MNNVITNKEIKLNAKHEQYLNLYLSKHNPHVQQYGNLTIFMFAKDFNGVEMPVIIAFRGRQSRPFSNYWYRTLERAYEALSEIKRNEDESQAWKAKRKAEQTAKLVELKNNLKEGDIYYTSFGYSMTLVNFYQVVEIKGQYVYFRELQVEATGYGTGKKWAKANEFYGDKIYKTTARGTKISRQRLKKWDGEGKYYNSWD